MNILLAILIIILLVIVYELWRIIQLFQKNPFLNITTESKSNLPDPDPLFEEAVKIVTKFGRASASLLQRRLNIGYARASKLIDRMEFEGYIGPAEGSAPRSILKKRAVPKRLVN